MWTAAWEAAASVCVCENGGGGGGGGDEVGSVDAPHAPSPATTAASTAAAARAAASTGRSHTDGERLWQPAVPMVPRAPPARLDPCRRSRHHLPHADRSFHGARLWSRRRQCRQVSHTSLAHVSHASLTHKSRTQVSHTSLAHTRHTHTRHTHTSLTPTSLTHTRLTPTSLTGTYAGLLASSYNLAQVRLSPRFFAYVTLHSSHISHRDLFFSVLLSLSHPLVPRCHPLVSPDVTHLFPQMSHVHSSHIPPFCFPFGQLFSAFFWGRVSDDYGRKPVLIFGLFATALAALGLGCATSYTAAVAARVAGGLLNANQAVARGMIRELTTAEQRARGFASVGQAWGIGFLLGPLVGGALSRPAATAKRCQRASQAAAAAVGALACRRLHSRRLSKGSRAVQSLLEGIRCVLEGRSERALARHR